MFYNTERMLNIEGACIQTTWNKATINSRVGEMSDYILHDNHNVYNEHILPEDYRIDVPIPRATPPTRMDNC